MRLPNERPHGIQIMKTCAALKKQGAEVELWAAVRRGGDRPDAAETFSFYGIAGGFPVRFLPVWDFLPSWWRLGFYLKSLSFFVAALAGLYRLKGDFAVYTREELATFLVFFTRRPVFWEAHMTSRSAFLRARRFKKLAGVVAISQSLKNLLAERNGIDEAKITVAHDAVDLEQFSDFLPAAEARRELGLPKEKKIALYNGGIFKQKGIFTFLSAAGLLDETWLFLVVGGNPGDETKDIKDFISRHNLKNVRLAGHVPHQAVKKYLAAADILVLPNSNLDERTSLFTSPLKLFEYMAAGRPIVASATPTIKEILNDGNAVLVEADNASALAQGLAWLLADEGLGYQLAECGRRDVTSYTWDERAKKILSLVSALS